MTTKLNNAYYVQAEELGNTNMRSSGNLIRLDRGNWLRFYSTSYYRERDEVLIEQLEEWFSRNNALLTEQLELF